MQVGWYCCVLAVALSTAACERAPSEAASSSSTVAPPAAATEKPAAAAAKTADAGHEHEAPHGGTLVELGEEFAHIELVLDAATGTLTAYALDGEAEQAVRLAQPGIDIQVVRSGEPPRQITLAGVANALTGETATDTSQFRAVVPALKGATAFDGTIARVVVRGSTFDGVAFRYPSDGHD